jgi:hypothetical protein
MVSNSIDSGLKASPASARIPRKWLALVRLFFLAQIVGHIVPVAWNLPAFYGKLMALEPGQNFPGWTAQELQAMVRTLGLSPHLVGASIFFSALACMLCFWGIAVLLLWRRSDTWVGLLSAFVLSGVGVGFSYFIFEANSLPVWAQPIYTLNAVLIWPTFFIILYLFPDGRFVPRWTRFLAPVPYALFLTTFWIADADTPAWMVGAVFAILLGGIASQIYRFCGYRVPTNNSRPNGSSPH